MKRFEHEVKSLKAHSKWDLIDMRKALAELGANGWEVVSVVSQDIGAREVLVFLKREVHENEQEKAA